MDKLVCVETISSDLHKGSGKTYTMEGTKNSPGIVYRALDELASQFRERQHLYDFKVTVSLLCLLTSVKASMLEIYNNELIDLFLPPNEQPQK